MTNGNEWTPIAGTLCITPRCLEFRDRASLFCAAHQPAPEVVAAPSEPSPIDPAPTPVTVEVLIPEFVTPKEET